MGMSASQARLLSLQARMSDVEYEGQQINQQRLVLSNKMNEVMEKMTNMDVPTPPSKQDFLYNEYSGKTKTGKKISAKMNDDGTFDITRTVQGMIVEDAGLQNITYGSTITGTPVDNLSPYYSVDKDGNYHECDANETPSVTLSDKPYGNYAFTKYQPSHFHRYYDEENPKTITPSDTAIKGLDGKDTKCYAGAEGDAHIKVPKLKFNVASASGYYYDNNYYGPNGEGNTNTPVYSYDGTTEMSEQELIDTLRDTGNYEDDYTFTDADLSTYKYFKNTKYNQDGTVGEDVLSSSSFNASNYSTNGYYTNDGYDEITLTFPLDKDDYDTLLKTYSNNLASILNGASEDFEGFNIVGKPEGTFAICDSNIAGYTGISCQSNDVADIDSGYKYTRFVGIEPTAATAIVGDGNYIKRDDCPIGEHKPGEVYTGTRINQHNTDVDDNNKKEFYYKEGEKYKKFTGDKATTSHILYAKDDAGSIKITNKSLDPEKLSGKYVYEPGSKNAQRIGEGGIDAEQAVAGLLSGKYKLMTKGGSGEGTMEFKDASNLDDLTVNGRKVLSMSEAYDTYGENSDFQDALNGLKNTFGKNDGYDENNYSVIINVSDSNKVTFAFCLTKDLKTGSGLGVDKGQVNVFNATHGSFEDTIEGVNVGYDENGYLKDITLPNGEVVHMTVEQKVDEDEYSIAMNKYEIAKIEYDKEVNELNKQTSIYQRQDKQLELKLTRLDTERNALNTEIDAVKKVIQDATEKGFKTFSG